MPVSTCTILVKQKVTNNGVLLFVPNQYATHNFDKCWKNFRNYRKFSAVLKKPDRPRDYLWKKKAHFLPRTPKKCLKIFPDLPAAPRIEQNIAKKARPKSDTDIFLQNVFCRQKRLWSLLARGSIAVTMCRFFRPQITPKTWLEKCVDTSEVFTYDRKNRKQETLYKNFNLSAQCLNWKLWAISIDLDFFVDKIYLGPIYTWRKICRRSLDEVSTKSQRRIFLRRYFVDKEFLI